MNYKQIPGWFDFEDYYDFLIEQAEPGDRMVEIGVFKGKSLRYLCDGIRDAGVDDVVVFGVDPLDDSYKQDTLRNLSDLTESGQCILLPYKSMEAVKTFDDWSLKSVFIDGSHEYKDVHQDIYHWFDKVMGDGFIGGHDHGNGFPGVVRAVKELFGNHVDFMGDSVWWKQVDQSNPPREGTYGTANE